MKKIALLATAALISVSAGQVFAADKMAEKPKMSLEDSCKAQAKKHHISADKVEAYVKTCTEKHSKKAAAKPQ